MDEPGTDPALPRDAVTDDIGPAPGVPLWVKVFGAALLVLLLLTGIMMLSGHGPGRHMG